MSCAECESFATRRWHGTYRMDCLACCARLVLSARPSRPHAGAMLAAIDRWLLAQSPPPFTTRDVTAKAREMLPQLEQQEAERKAQARATAMAAIREVLHDR